MSPMWTQVLNIRYFLINKCVSLNWHRKHHKQLHNFLRVLQFAPMIITQPQPQVKNLPWEAPKNQPHIDKIFETGDFP